MRALVVAAMVVAADQVSKLVVRRSMPAGESVEVITGLFYFVHVRNTGGAFGLMPGWQAVFVVATVLVIVAIIALLVLGRPHAPIPRLALGLVLGGAVGNLIDRIALGRVVDFLSFKIFPPVFNIADAAVVVGAGLFMMALLFEPRRQGGDQAEVGEPDVS